MNVRSQPLVNWLLAAGFTGVFLLVWWIGHPSATPAEPGSLAASLNATSAGQAAGTLPLVIAQPVTGNWTGNINLGSQHSELHFNVEEHNGQLSGTVHFPVGDGIIQSGSRTNNQVSMVTLNHLQVTGQPLLTEFSGTYEGNAMRLTMKTDTGNDELTLQRTR